MGDYDFVNPYDDEDCAACEKEGSPCLRCAADANGVDGPGKFGGQRLLLPASTDPNVFMSMIFWMNQHPTETVGIRLVPFEPPTRPVLDLNICALGLLGRSYVGSLGPTTNRDTVFLPVNVTAPIDIRTAELAVIPTN